MDKVEWLLMFATNLQAQMNKKGFSQRKLANASGLSEASISRYLNRLQAPGIAVVAILASALGCEMSDLIDN